MDRWANESLWALVDSHADDDPATFLLHSKLAREEACYVADQIAGRKEAREKCPSVLKYGRFVFPPHINRQQSSSEATARYKASLLAKGASVADITGGFGIDDLFLAERAGKVLHIERDEALCAMTAWNASQAGLSDKLQCLRADSVEWLQGTKEHFDMLYADPSRRDGQGRKVVSFADSTPNVLPLLPRMFEVADRLLVKASPMADISKSLKELGCVAEVHVVEWRGECKEVLFLCERAGKGLSPKVVAAAIDENGASRFAHAFQAEEEAAAMAAFAKEMGRYLYEPSPALMKAGCFKLLGKWYGVRKLAPATHLYTSDDLVASFPGRILEVMQAVRPKEIGTVLPDGRASVLCRNYPVSAVELARRHRLRDGSGLVLVATTLARQRSLWLCRPVSC